MAKDLEIRITANTSQAIEGMDAFQKSVSGLRREVISSDAALRDTQEGTDEYTKAKNTADEAVARYNKAVEKTIGIMNREGLTVSSLTKNMKLLSKEYDALSYGLKGTDNGAFGALNEAMAKYGDALKDVKDINATLRDDMEKNANSNNLAYYSLIGDKLGYAREQLRQYEDILRSSISLQGASSEKAKKAAEAYKTQAKEVEKLEAASKKASSRIKNLIKSFVSAQAIVYLFQKGFNLLRTAIVDWAAAASKAEETANLFNTTFDRLSVTANRVATEMSTRLGTANSTMQESLGLFADMAAGYGQTQAAALAFAEAAAQTSLDLMSYKNLTGDVTSLMQTFASGLAGNLENFRKMGIIVTQTEINSRLAAKGLDKLSGSALQFAKVQETLTILQEKSANAMGDMERTLDSTENLNRRVNEANKQLQETLGRGINTVLNPLKEAWLSIADAINDATLAQDLFKSGQKNIDVFGFPASKILAFQKAVGDIGRNFTSSYYMTAGNSSFGTARQVVNETNAGIIEQELIRLATTYNATMDDFIAVLGEDVDPALMSMVETVLSIVDKAREEERAREEAAKALESMKSSAIGFIDSLASIAGVSLDVDYGAGIAQIASSGPYAQGSVDLTNALAIQDAISDIENGDWKDFLDSVELAFEEVEELDGLESKADSYVELYKAISDALATDKLNLDDAENVLESIVEKWEEINLQIKALEAESDRVEKIFDLTGDTEEEYAKVLNDIRTFDMTDDEKALDDIEAQRNLALTYARTAEEIEMVNAAFDNLKSSTIALQKLQKEQERKEKYEEQRSDISDEITDLYHSIIDLGMNERDAANAEIMRQRASVLGSGDYTPEEREKLDSQFDLWLEANEKYYDRQVDELVDAFRESMNPVGTLTYSYAGFGNNAAAQEAYNEAMQEGMAGWIELRDSMKELGASSEELAAAQVEAYRDIRENAIEAGTKAGNAASAAEWDEIGQNALNALGGVGDVISTISDAASSAAGPWGVIINLLIKLISQTEVFVALGNSIVDSILPALNAFLYPLLEVIERTNGITTELLYDILNPLYDIIYQIAEVTLVLYDASEPLMEILRTISDMVGDSIYPYIAAVAHLLKVLTEPLFEVFQIINALLVPVFNVFAPLLDTIARGFITVYAAVNVAVNFVIDSLKWVAGWVMTGITEFINGIIGLINKLPFVNIGKIDNSMFKEWAHTDVIGNVDKNWNEAFGLLEEIRDYNMEIADHTEKQDIDFSDFTKMYEAGYLTADEYNALVADKLGKDYVNSNGVLANANNYIENDGGTYISFGDVTIRVDGSGDPNATAKAVIKEMERLARTGRGTFDYAV